MCKVAPNPIRSNYTKRRFFAVLVSENTGKTLFRTYKKAHFRLFGYLREQTKGAKGAAPERLNAPTTGPTTHETKDNRGTNLAPPGWWSGDGWELPSI